MSLETILSKYDQIVEGVRHYRVNYGGCGSFALALGKELKAKGIKFHYVVLFHQLSNETYHEVRNYVKTNNIRDFAQYTWWTHVMIRVDNKYIDAEGIKYEPRLMHYRNPTKVITEEFLTDMVKAPIWNPSYERINTVKVKSIIKKVLA